jgi:import receptor subunit TOM20
MAEEKSSVTSEGSAPSSTVTPDMLRSALEQVKQEEPPSSTEEKEAYFMTQVGMGEQLAAQGMSPSCTLLEFHAQKSTQLLT